MLDKNSVTKLIKIYYLQNNNYFLSVDTTGEAITNRNLSQNLFNSDTRLTFFAGCNCCVTFDFQGLLFY